MAQRSDRSLAGAIICKGAKVSAMGVLELNEIEQLDGLDCIQAMF